MYSTARRSLVLDMCLHLAVLAVVVVAAVLLWMCGPDLERVATGIVVLPLKLRKGGCECGFVVAGMLSLREIARRGCSGFRIGWSETRLGCFSETRVDNAPRTERWRELRVVEV
jgi:hypothetical protein